MSHRATQCSTCSAFPTCVSSHTHLACSLSNLRASVQIMVSAGRATAALWDAQAGTFLGTLTPLGNSAPASVHGGAPVDTADEYAINTTVGLQLDTVTQRAMYGVGMDVPPLGAPLRESEPAEEQTVARKLDTAAKTAHSFASTFAKKCAIGDGHSFGPSRCHTGPVLAHCRCSNSQRRMASGADVRNAPDITDIQQLLAVMLCMCMRDCKRSRGGQCCRGISNIKGWAKKIEDSIEGSAWVRALPTIAQPLGMLPDNPRNAEECAFAPEHVSL